MSVSNQVSSDEKAPAEAEAVEPSETLVAQRDGGGGTRTPKRLRAPHFEGESADHGGTPPNHGEPDSPSGEDPDSTGREPATTADPAQPVTIPVSSRLGVVAWLCEDNAQDGETFRPDAVCLTYPKAREWLDEVESMQTIPGMEYIEGRITALLPAAAEITVRAIHDEEEARG